MTPPGPPRRLVVVDMQRIFAGGPWGAPRFAETVPVIERLVQELAETTFTRFVAPDDPAGAWRAYYAQWAFALQPPDAPDYQLVDEFAAHQDATVDATTFGKWDALHRAVDLSPGDRLLICGVSTECCVLSTVLAAADAGMTVQVIADACAGVDDESHQKALELMALYSPLVEIVTSADVLA